MRRTAALPNLMAALLLAGCLSYPAPSPAHFERSWNAALGATADAGVQVTSANRDAGRITGTKDGTPVSIELRPLMDGRIEVSIDAPGARETQPSLDDRWRAAYQQRMGR